MYWAVGGLDPSGHPWIYPMVSNLFLFPTSLVAEFILNPIQLFPSPQADWFVRLTSLSPRWTGARNPSRRLSQRLALLLVSDADHHLDHHPHLEPGPDYKHHDDCDDGKMTKVQKMIMIMVKINFEI